MSKYFYQTILCEGCGKEGDANLDFGEHSSHSRGSGIGVKMRSTNDHLTIQAEETAMTAMGPSMGLVEQEETGQAEPDDEITNLLLR